MSRKYLLILIGLSLGLFSYGQSCDIAIQIEVIDHAPNSPLPFVNVFIKETKTGAVSDENGILVLKSLCPGTYHLSLSHLACENEEIFLQLDRDTSFQIYMHHTDHVMNDFIISGKKEEVHSSSRLELGQEEILDKASYNLANLLDDLSGVSTLRNGTGIAKPVVHGLYGNRLNILNNGIAQAGQQWGNDHSPELDPLSAQEITVIKGAGALAYFGSNAGPIILLEPGKISHDPHIHGQANYVFSSNGLGNGLHFRLQQGKEKVAWRVTSTFKKSGDYKSADYFLNNTGSQEAHFSFQLEKSFKERWKTSLYLSSFNTKIGILRGAQIGNLSDLEIALEREEPFFTEAKFSYRIDAPKQQVHHQLLKLKADYLINEFSSLNVIVAGQWNLRKEFDVRRSGRSETPSLNISQLTTFAEASFNTVFKNQTKLKTGVQLNWIDNTNNPETGILPLIPDYRSFQTGLFLTLDKTIGKSYLEGGLRYDNTIQDVPAISQTSPRTIIRYNETYHNFGLSGTWQHFFKPSFSTLLSTKYTTRNPGINELYSIGLHQGVSGIEEGSVGLQSEKSWKSSVGLSLSPFKFVSIEALAYAQFVQDYIYLDPQEEVRLTIRGAFPVFKYAQTNAQIWGLDLGAKVDLSEACKLSLDYNFIKGKDLTQDLPLINLPSNQIQGKLSYEFESLKVGKKQLEGTTIEINNRFVFQQKNILPEQDFVAPPNAYNLLGFSLSTELQAHKLRYRFFVNADNVLNVSYRDYLNRQRYFSDDLGVNVMLGLNLSF